MMISTRGRYAVRVMLDLAIHDTGEYIKVKQIAKRQDISEKSLEQIIAILQKAGYCIVYVGAQGGYRLQRTKGYPWNDLRLTEGSLSPVACLSSDENECKRCDTCDTLAVWKDLEQAINNVVDHVTIADLLEQHQERVGSQYVI